MSIPSPTNYPIVNGLTESQVILNNASGSAQVLGYMATITPGASVKLKASYPNYYTAGSTAESRAETAKNLGWDLKTTTSQAAAYEAVKERTAGVELEAHCRAQNILDQANGQAKDLRRSMEQWMGRVEREYDALRSEVESTVSHAADQLEKANKCLDRMTALLSDQDVALEALSQAYDNTDPEKVPAPVPLNED